MRISVKKGLPNAKCEFISTNSRHALVSLFVRMVCVTRKQIYFERGRQLILPRKIMTVSSGKLQAQPLLLPYTSKV